MSDSTPAPEIPVVDDFAEVVRLVTGRPDVFVRYSQGPTHDGPDGTSRDYEAGLDMPGLSVTTVAPEPWWTRPPEDWVARRLCKYEHLAKEPDRFPWLLTGRIVGYGPDHEPLLAETEPIAWVGDAALAQAQQVYAERFDVAQDSRPSS